MYSELHYACVVSRSDGLRDEHIAVVNSQTRQIISVEYHIFYQGKIVNVSGKNNSSKLKFEANISLSEAQKNEIREKACAAYPSIVEQLAQDNLISRQSSPKKAAQDRQAHLQAQQANPPQATVALPITPNLNWKIEVVPSRMLPYLVCSFDFGGNAYQFYFHADGALEKISSIIAIDGDTYDVKLNLVSHNPRFYSIKKNGLQIKSSLAEAEMLWGIIEKAFTIAEKNYSPEVHEATELACIAPEMMNEADESSKKINAISLKVKHLRTVFNRTVLYLQNAKKYDFDESKGDAYFTRLFDQGTDYLYELSILGREDLTQIEREALLEAEKACSITVLDISRAQTEYREKSIPLAPVSASKTVILIERNELTSELTYFIHNYKILFDDQSSITCLSFDEILENVKCRCVVTCIASLNTNLVIELESLNGNQAVPSLTDKEKMDIEKRIRDHIPEFQFLYSPVEHDEMEMGSQCAVDTIENIQAEFTRLKKLSGRLRFMLDYFSKLNASQSVSKVYKKYYQELLDYYLYLLEKRSDYFQIQIDRLLAQNPTQALKAIHEEFKIFEIADMKYIDQLNQKLEAQETASQQANPPQATVAQPIAPNLNWKIEVIPSTMLPYLVCSFDFAGNAYQFYFHPNGAPGKISSVIVIDGDTYDVKINLVMQFVRFYSIKKNGLQIKSSLAEAEMLWGIIEKAFTIAEKNYSPEVHEATELACIAPEMTKEIVKGSKRINAILLKVGRLETVFERTMLYLQNAKKYDFDESKVDERFQGLLDLYKDCLNEIDNSRLECTTHAEKEALDGIEIKCTAMMFNVTAASFGYKLKSIPLHPIDASKTIILIERNELTSELTYFIHNYKILFDDQGSITCLSFDEILKNVKCRCVVTECAGSPAVRIENLNRDQAERGLTDKERMDINEKIHKYLFEFRFSYSPIEHEEMVVRTQRATIDQKEVIGRLSLFFQRMQSYHRFLTVGDGQHLPTERKEYCQSMSSTYLKIFVNRLECLEREALEENKKKIIALRKRYETAYPQAAQSISKIDKQSSKQEVAEAEEARKELLQEESKKSVPKPPQKKSAPKTQTKKPISAPKVAPASNEEKKFNKDFEFLNKLMDEKLNFFKKPQCKLSEELKKEIDVIEEKFEILKKYYNDHALSVNEGITNKLARLERLWGEIQAFVPAQPPAPTGGQKNAPPTSAVDTAPATPVQPNPPRAIAPIDFDNPSPVPPPAATAALVGAQQRFLPASRRNDPYAATVLMPEEEVEFLPSVDTMGA